MERRIRFAEYRNDIDHVQRSVKYPVTMDMDTAGANAEYNKYR